MRKLLELFISFFKIGLITFGGGLAMLSILQREVVQNKKWATDEEIVNYYAIGQCTPGIIAINTATFIGYKQKGISGAIFATAGMVFPSLIIILFIASFISNFTKLETVQHIFSGIRVAVAALVTSAVIKLWKAGIKDKFGRIIFILTLFVCLIFKISTILVILSAIILGLILCKFPQNTNSKENK